MTVDLWMLFASTVLTWAMAVAASTPTLLADLRWALGNRDEVHELPIGWPARLRRASTNMNENLPIFAALVLVAHVTGRADATTAIGAELFFYSRVVHALIYVAGIPYVRTLVWCVSVLGMTMVGAALV